MKETILNRNWTLINTEKQISIPIRIPGDNITALYEAEIIPDPYYGKNEMDLQWIGRSDWSFENRFTIDKTDLTSKNTWVHFDSIDTLAEVYLNGTLLGRTENMFRAYRFSIKDILLEGENTLEVRVASPEEGAKRLAKVQPYPVPYGEFPVQSPNRNLVRKTACHAGWDWGPCLMISGLYGKIALISSDLEIIEAVHTNLIQNGDDWTIEVSLDLFSGLPGETEIEAECSGAKISETVNLTTGSQTKKLKLEVNNPDLWWPAGYGEQPLYELKISSGENRTSRMIGFRTVDILTEEDDKGTGMVFQVNGREIFCKGANWIPMDALPARESEKRYEELLTAAVNANMNMIRVWGGGKYEEDDFYDTCDRLGLLIWHDFMFACSLYPADKEFLDNVKKEVSYQIKRLKSHPSIALWCGNNENVGALTWFEESKANRDRYLIDYYKLNEAVVGETVKELDPSRKWWSSSPSAGEGDFSDCWHNDTRGDMHYWSVWHEGKPFEAYYEVTPRFCSEFGFQSFSSLETVKTFADEEQMNITSPVMEHHQRNDRGNTIIATTLSRYYRFPQSFEEMLYLSQVQQAFAITTAVEYWRSRRPTCMGTLIWQLNDNWPVASWSSLEYNGKWKPLHYAAKRFFAPLHLVILKKEDKISIHGCSDIQESRQGTLRLDIIDFDGKVKKSFSSSCSIHGDSSALLFEETVDKRDFPEAEHFCRAVFTPAHIKNQGSGSGSGSEKLENTILLAPPKACAIRKTKINARLEKSEGGQEIILTSEKPAFNVCLELPGYKAEFSDNCFSLIPGEERRIEIYGDSLAKLDPLIIHSLRNFGRN
ncbi:MAG: glycoside hydrolase family 2 protein [Spirochaetales bacterium]|nr:glycoside hydrolase family 2 protein [Spirochaetales bacterium]